MRALAALFSGPGAARRGLLFALSGLLAVYAGFFAVTPVTGGHLIIAWGYYFILGVFALFVALAWGLAGERSEVWVGWLRRPGAAGLAILLGTAFAIWSDTYTHKILYDEFVIQGTAYQMHIMKQVSTILRAYTINGTWLSIDPYLDKRPYFFPFLVSLLHDLTGYRIENMFVMNGICAAALLGMLYWFARGIAGRKPAIFAVASMAMLPLFGQNATGAGMDLHNLTMIALVACLSVLFLRRPTDDRLSLLVLGTVLLTESRYESAVFIVPVAAVILMGWLAAGRAILPWPVILAPVLLVPCAWHSRFFAATPAFWQLKEGQTSAFGWANIRENLRGDTDFLFNAGPGLANSWFLSWAGVLGMAWLAWMGWRRLRAAGRPPLSAEARVALAFGGGVAAHFAVLLFYWWAKFNDLMAARFSLPVSLAFAVLAAAMVASLASRGLPALRLAWAGLGVWFLTSGLPALDLRFYTVANLGMQELRWERQYVRDLQSRQGPVLIVSNKSTIPFVLWHIPVVLNSVAALKGDDIRYHMGQDTFSEVIVSQAIRPITDDGQVGIDPADTLPPSFHLETIAERRFGGRWDRLSRVVSIDPSPEPPRKGEDQPPAAPVPARSISWLQSRSEPSVAALTSSALSR
jgi:hypothetical protein